MMKRARILLLGLIIPLLSGCAATYVAAYPAILEGTPAATAQWTPSPIPAAVLTATPSPTPAPTPEPPAVATVGFIGDILMMTSQIENAELPGGGYDFSHSFEPMRPLFEGMDLMCGNFECTLAGEDAGYTRPRSTPPPPTEEDPAPTAPYQTFNAPDELAKDLFDAGFDVLTTANNHCIDRDQEGLFRTIAVLRAAGLMTTGTFRSEQERQTPLTVDVNGIKVCIVAATASVNRKDGRLTDEAREYAVCRLYDERLQADIAACREAGAEFIIVCPHWGTEYESGHSSKQEKLAKELIAMGADAIIGSHPHVVQPIEWVTAERDGAEVTAPVVYSLGNFVSNMSPSPRDQGLFVKLILTREAEGSPVTAELEYLPTLCIRQKVDKRTLHQVLPCYLDPSLITAAAPLDGGDHEKLDRARAHVIKVAGEAFPPLG